MEKEILEKVVFNIKEELSTVDDVSGLCYYATNNTIYDLEEAGIETKMVNVKNLCDICYDHYFALAKVETEDYLIDLTYKQFLKQANETFRFSNRWPSEVLQETDKGNQLLNALLDKGYTAVNDEKINVYLKSFNPNLDKNFIIDNLTQKETKCYR